MQRSLLFGSGALSTWTANIFDLGCSYRWNVLVANKNLFYFTGLYFDLKKIYTFKVKLAG